MSKELVISSNRHETRVAILEDDQVFEVYHQRENEYSLAGSIHKGRVTRVLPGMQSAFVDIGLDRDAFLYVSDFFEDNEEYDKIVTSVEDKVFKMDRTPPLAVVAEAPAPADAAPATDAPAPVAAAEAGVAAASASSAPVEAPASEPEQRRDDRDRRGGRRSRRRRGQRGGRGLPDSKFYSPGHHATETAPPAEPRTLEPAQPVAPAREDMLVLPGESLAKYTGPARMVEDSEPATTEESAGEEHQFEPEEWGGLKPRSSHVASAVADERYAQVGDTAQMLLYREDVGEHLDRMAVIRQSINDRHVGGRHLGQPRVVRGPKDDGVAVPREHPRRVTNGLTPAELAALDSEHHRVQPKLGAANLERDPSAGTRLLEDDRDGPTREHLGSRPLRLTLQRGRDREDVANLCRGKVAQTQEIALGRLHGALPNGSAKTRSASSSSEPWASALVTRVRARSRSQAI